MHIISKRSAGIAGVALAVLSLPAVAATQAGKPTPEFSLLCGTSAGPTDHLSGQSGVDHPTGLSAMGGSGQKNGEYDSSTTPFGAGACDSENSSGGTFAWAVDHANVRPNEQGTEHADASGTSLVKSGSYAVTFNGHITNYDFNNFGTGDTPGPDSSGSRQVYYDSAGQFNTEGGAQVGNHYRGTYRTEYYKDDNNNNCKTSGTVYCFEA